MVPPKPGVASCLDSLIPRDGSGIELLLSEDCLGSLGTAQWEIGFSS